MQYRPFGKTGILVSALGLGAMRLPMMADGKHMDEEKGIAVIHRAFELGVNYIDTAPGYSRGKNEIIVGKALKGWRDRVYVSTKNPIRDASGERWRGRLERSLRKLDIDYVDFYHMWGIDWRKYEKRILAPGGPLQAAQRAKEEGLIHHISFSFHDKLDKLIRLIDSGHFETMLVQYNLLDRANEEGITHAKEKGLGVAVMGPVGGGRLSGFSEEIRQLLPGKFERVPELALRFVLSHPGVSVALSGMSTMEMVEENAATASRTEMLSQDERRRIQEVLDRSKKLADLYCTGCGYCMPCQHDINIPANLEYMNYYRVYGLKEYAQSAYAKLGQEGHYVKGLPASACLECGECEDKCPQKIPIRQQLKEVAKALG